VFESAFWLLSNLFAMMRGDLKPDSEAGIVGPAYEDESELGSGR
jgi:hypothetical protein